MPRKAKPRAVEPETFGQRLVRLRTAAGYSQVDLARELGISRRMMNYYEHRSTYPLADLLARLARALHISADQLLDLAPVTKRSRPIDARLVHRLHQMEQLDPDDRRQIGEMIDALLERQRLRQKVIA